MFKFPWKLSDLKEISPNGKKVFSCFHCGGGSTMGYKLAGFDVIGGVEIDPAMMQIYKANHNPRLSYLMGVQEFNKIPDTDLPKDLFNLDILDGSPPCSSFSMAGSREKKWGIKRHFREGQTEQVLDDLFFHFIETSRKLQPKVVIAENVKGLIMGKARGYVKQINEMFNLSGYDVQLFLLNSAFMGVPQRRERTFFIARKKSLKLNKINLTFNERQIPVLEAFLGLSDTGKKLSEVQKKFWEKTPQGKSLSDAHPKGNMFTWTKLDWQRPASTVTSGPAQLHPFEARHISNSENRRLQSFPEDYNFIDQDVRYVCGMSVPPIMMAHIARQIDRQLLNG